jgi:hypothetical protein
MLPHEKKARLNEMALMPGLRIEIIRARSHDFKPEDFAERSSLSAGFERSFARV